MSAIARKRINPRLKRDAQAVLESIGLTHDAALQLYYAQIVNLGGLPFVPSQFPALAEYGATVEDAERAASGAVREVNADLKSGRAFVFKGTLRR